MRHWLEEMLLPKDLGPIGLHGFGDDGVAVFDGVNTYAFASKVGSVYTLSRDVYLADGSSVEPGCTVVFPNNTRLLCNGKFTVNGELSGDGNGFAGGIGGAGVGGIGGAGSSNDIGVQALAGGHGGAGGHNNGSTKAGGAGGTYPGFSDTDGGGRFEEMPYAAKLVVVDKLAQFYEGTTPSVALLRLGGGAGGGGGGKTAGTAGDGGPGGGAFAVVAKALVNNGSIHSNGKPGTNATSGDGGGGGGGQGGVIVAVSDELSGPGTYAATGGLPGTGFGGGVTGDAGTDGKVYQLTVQT
jgi:hypothetical protein